jgi:C4-dicarboxylate-specific signal transduction histidine kinase
MGRRQRSGPQRAKGPRFWHKVLAALLVVGVAPILLVSVVSIRSTRSDLTELGVTNIQQRSTSTAAALDAYLANRLEDIVLVSRIPDVIRFVVYNDPAIKDAARDAMKAAASRSQEYESVAIVDLTGRIVAASVPTDEGTDVKFREYFLQPKATGNAYISDPSYSVITNKPALFLSAAVKDGQGRVLAVVRSRLNLAAIWNIVEADGDSVGAGAHSFLVDDYGIRLAVSETKGHRDQAESLIYKPIAPIDPAVAAKLAADKRFGLKTPDQLVVDPLPSLKTALDGLKAGTAQFGFGTGAAEQRGVVAKLTAKPWSYVLAVPLGTYTKAADDATFNAASVVAIGLLLSFVVGVLLTRSLVRPLRQLVGVATRVSTGDVDLRAAHFDTRKGDDITREVASAFDRLLNALRFYALADETSAGGDDPAVQD